MDTHKLWSLITDKSIFNSQPLTENSFLSILHCKHVNPRSKKACYTLQIPWYAQGNDWKAR